MKPTRLSVIHASLFEIQTRLDYWNEVIELKANQRLFDSAEEASILARLKRVEMRNGINRCIKKSIQD